ncbi:calcium-binding protein [Roseovarius nanhaiticus]|uniref:calcium-binding protein n=1 Tax=Roseovarius nanhaiticus TaxID=573024 RepID=UPI0024927558|nr:calcium-binding protein [Roseovarius nanhaiticus]
MPGFQHRGLLGQAAEYLESDVRGFLAVPAGIIAIGGPNGGLSTLVPAAGSLARVTAGTGFDGGPGRSLRGEANLIDIAGTQAVVMTNSTGTGLLQYRVNADGSLGVGASVAVPELAVGGPLTSSAGGYIFAARADGTIGTFTADASGRLQAISSVADTAQTYGAAPAALRMVEVAGKEFLLTFSRSEAGVTSYAVNPANGALTAKGSLGAQEGLGINDTAICLRNVDIGGRSFVIAASMDASAAGAALTVLEIDAGGALVARDHVGDSRDTRFGQIQCLEIIEHEGRAYAIAAGGDDGISLLTMLPDGRLIHLDTIAHDLGLGLESISAMTAIKAADAIEVILASQTNAGLTQFTVSLAQQGQTISGNAAVQNGTAQDDLIIAGDGDNALLGGAGDDILLDGAGSDTLTGGAGRDIFLLSPDDATDDITDFQLGEDRIDLTLRAGLYSPNDIAISSTSWGARLTIGDDVTNICTSNGTRLELEDVRTALAFDLERTPIVETNDVDPQGLPLPSPAVTLTGTAGQDRLEGGIGDDSIDGEDGEDVLIGNDGSDTIKGGRGSDSILGGPGDDLLLGGKALDTLRGGAGDDRLEGHKGFDLVYGDAGNDTLTGGLHADTLYGGDGNDSLLGEMGHDLLYGGDGNDILEGGVEFDTLIGGEGDDTLLGGAHRDTLQGGNGNDFLNGQNGFDLLEGGAGDDTLIGEANADTIYGGDGDDSLDGSDGFDFLDGGRGNDTMFGGANADRMFGREGHDALYGEVGHDHLEGGAGNDLLSGGIDFDTLIGGDGNDTLLGGAHRDTLIGGDGDDYLNGQNGFDRLEGGTGHDTLIGEANADTLIGGAGDDRLDGGEGFDRLDGGTGDDTLIGGANADTLLGGDGDDWLFAGIGNDFMRGGAGADVFVFNRGDEFNRIADFENGTDRLMLETGDNAISDLRLHEAPLGLVVAWEGGQVLMDGMSIASFDSSDVIFL